MVLGDRSEIDEATAEAFRASGTYHVLALSGAQVALVAGLVVAVLRFLVVRPSLQALVTGAAARVLHGPRRAATCPCVRAVADGRRRARGPGPRGRRRCRATCSAWRRSCSWSYRPAWVGDVGFQLSFGATLGILALSGPLTQGLPRLPLRLELALAASVAAQAALAPVLAASFHRLAPAARAAQPAGRPASSAVLLCGLAVVAGVLS